MVVTTCNSSSSSWKCGLKTLQNIKDSITPILQDNIEEGSDGGCTMQKFQHKFTGQPYETPFTFHMNQNFLCVGLILFHWVVWGRQAAAQGFFWSFWEDKFFQRVLVGMTGQELPCCMQRRNKSDFFSQLQCNYPKKGLHLSWSRPPKKPKSLPMGLSHEEEKNNRVI